MYRVVLNWDGAEPLTNDAVRWCKEQFGPSYNPDTNKHKWMVRVDTFWYVFYFEKEEHANWFTMRWG